jgi:hypothetical protein
MYSSLRLNKYSVKIEQSHCTKSRTNGVSKWRIGHWLDQIILELIQHKFKLIDFPSTVEGLQHHSINMPRLSRCVTHCNLEYSRPFDVDSFDVQSERGIPDDNSMDKGNKKKPAVLSKRIREKTMIAEIVCLTNALVKTPGRIMTDGVF